MLDLYYIYNHLIFNLNCGIYCIGVTTSLDYNTIKNDGTPCMVLKKSLFTLNENKLAVNNYANDIEVS